MLVCKLASMFCDSSAYSIKHLQNLPSVSLLPRIPHASYLAAMHLANPTKTHRAFSPLLIYILILSTPYALWHSICAITHTSTPIVVVTSESMEPVYQRGDVLFVSNRDPDIELGEIVVCWLEGRRLPFVHRVIEKHVLSVGTKGNDRYRGRNIKWPFVCSHKNCMLIKIVRTSESLVKKPMAS